MRKYRFQIMRWEERRKDMGYAVVDVEARGDKEARNKVLKMFKKVEIICWKYKNN